MSSESGIKINVDASQGKSELRSFTQAVGSAASKLEELRAAASAAGTGGFASLGNQIRQLSSGFNALKNVSGGVAAARELRSFSTAAASFKALSSTQISNINNLAKALKQFENIKISKFSGGDIASLARGIDQLRVPSSGDIARLPQLVRELQKVGGVKIGAATAAEISQVGRAFASLSSLPANTASRISATANALNGLKAAPGAGNALATLAPALAGIKAPSAGTVANLGALIRALSSGNAAQVGAMTSALQRLNGLNMRVGVQASAVIRQPVQPPVAANQNAFAGFASGSGQAGSALRSLESSFSLTSAAASAFGAAIGGLSLHAFAESVLDTGNKLLGFKLSMDAIATSPREAGDQLNFLIGMSQRTGTALESNIDSFTRFAAAARTLGTSVGDTQKIYESFSTAFAVMHVSAQRQNLAFLAIQEAFSKDQVQKQQAVRQLATELPGAVSIMSQALGVTTRQLEEHFKKGDLDPQEVFGKMADVLQQRFGSQLPEALKHSQASLNQLGNAFTVFKNSVFENGFDSGLSAMVRGLTQTFESAGIEDMGKRVGEAFKTAFETATALGQTAADFAGPITVFASAIGSLMIARTAASALALLRSPIVLVGASAVATYEAMNAMGGSFADFAGPASVAVGLLTGVGATGALIAAGFGIAIEAARLLGTALSHIIPQGWRDSIQADVNWLANQIDSLTGGHALHDFRVSQGFDLPQSVTTADGIRAATDRSQDAGKAAGEGWRAGFDAAAKQLQSDIAALSSGLGNVGKNGIAGAFNVGPLATFSEHLKKVQADADALGQKFHGMGDYEKNLADEQERNRRKVEELSEVQQKVVDKFTSSSKARQLKEDLESIAGLKGKMLDGKPISDAQIAQMSDAAKRAALPHINPTAGVVQGYNDQLTEQIAAYRRAADGSISFANALEQEKAVLDAKNKSLAEGAPFAERDAAAIRKMVGAMQELKAGGDNPLSQWASSVKDLKTSMDDVVKNGIDKMADSLADFVVTGKANFRSLAQSISKEILSITIKNALKQAIDMSGLSNPLSIAQNALAGGKSYVDGAMKGLGSLSSSTNVGVQNVQAGVVNISGASLGGIGNVGTSGSSAFGLNGGSGAALGGLTPSSPIPTPVSLDQSGVNALAQTSTGFSSAFPLSISMAGAGAGAFSISDRSAFSAPPLGSTFVPTSQAPSITTFPGSSILSRAPLGVSNGLPAFGSQTPASLFDGANANQALAQAGIAGTGESGLRAFSLNGLNPSQLRAALMGRVQSDFGLSKDQAAGVVGNLSMETNGFKNMQELKPLIPGSRGGYGLAQWTGARRRDFEAYAAGQGKPTNDIDAQYDFLKQEMNGRGGAWTGDGLAGLRRQGSLEDSTRYFRGNFERPGVVNDPARLTHARQSLRDFDAQRNVDTTPTGSIGQVGQPTQQIGQMSKQFADQFKTAMQPATTQVGQALTTNLKTATTQIGPQLTSALSPATGSLSQVTKGVTDLGQSSMGSVPGLDQIIQEISKLGSGGGGIGGLLGGLFSEGGYSENPVSHGSMRASSWHGAPHYAEGTPNTSGGMPAILHANEAVIPLTRGRKIPIEMKGGDGEGQGGGRPITNNLSINVESKDHDSFRRGADQLRNDMMREMGRLMARNG